MLEMWDTPFDRDKWVADLKVMKTIPPGPSWGELFVRWVVLPTAAVGLGVFVVRRIQTAR